MIYECYLLVPSLSAKGGRLGHIWAGADYHLRDQERLHPHQILHLDFLSSGLVIPFVYGLWPQSVRHCSPQMTDVTDKSNLTVIESDREESLEFTWSTKHYICI